jgi:hypothetical protein
VCNNIFLLLCRKEIVNPPNPPVTHIVYRKFTVLLLCLCVYSGHDDSLLVLLYIARLLYVSCPFLHLLVWSSSTTLF